MESLRRNPRSRYCMFVINDANKELSVDKWDHHGITEICYVPFEGNYRVLVKCSKPHRKAGWLDIMKSLEGRDLDYTPCSRFYNPFQKFTKEGVVKHFKSPVSVVAPVVVTPQITTSTPSPTTCLGFLQSKYDAKVDLMQLAKELLGELWVESEMAELSQWKLLEYHRCLMRLEDVIITDEARDYIKKEKDTKKTCLVVDPITLVVPLLVCQAINTPPTVNMLDMVEFECQKVAQVYNHAIDMCTVDFEPLQYKSNDFNQQLLEHRVRKMEMMIGDFYVKYKSEWIKAYLRIVSRSKNVMKTDTLEAGGTKYLPPTASLSDAVYNVVKFLSK